MENNKTIKTEGAWARFSVLKDPTIHDISKTTSKNSCKNFSFIYQSN